jgi:Putative prokaryotic signal transducing protein
LTVFSGKKQWSKRPGLSQVCTTAGLLQAAVVKGKLEANDIPVLLEYESLGPVMGLTIDGLGEVRVLVPEDKAEAARALLEESEELDDELPDELLPGETA